MQFLVFGWIDGTSAPCKLHPNWHRPPILDPFKLRNTRSTAPRAAGSSSSPLMRLPFHQTESKPTLSWRTAWRVEEDSSGGSSFAFETASRLQGVFGLGRLMRRFIANTGATLLDQHQCSGNEQQKQDVDVGCCGNDAALKPWPEAVKH